MSNLDKIKVLLFFALLGGFLSLAAFKNQYSAIVFCLLVSIASVWWMIATLKSITVSSQSRNWPRVKFIFLNGAVNVRPPMSGRGSQAKYIPKFQLQYQAGGTEYICDSKKVIGLKSRLCYTFQDAQKVLNELRLGGEAAVCPSDPDVLYLKTGVTWKHISSLVGSITVSVFALVTLVILLISL